MQSGVPLFDYFRPDWAKHVTNDGIGARGVSQSTSTRLWLSILASG